MAGNFMESGTSGIGSYGFTNGLDMALSQARSYPSTLNHLMLNRLAIW